MWFTEPDEMEMVLVETPLELETEDALEHLKRNKATSAPGLSREEVIRTMPVVSIGHPETWPLSEVYSPRQMPRTLRAKLSQADFYLVRLACSFRSLYQESRIQWARFYVSLLPDEHGQAPLAVDLYPLEVFQEVKRQVTLSLDPTLKFREIEVSSGQIEFGLEYRELLPRISASGAGQADPSWDYTETKGITLQGCKWMYLLVKAPKGMVQGRATLDLLADVVVRGLRLPVVVRRKQPQAATQLTAKLWG